MIDKLELTHLRTLDALNRFDTISAAAEHLDVSQQAVSLQLKKLRAILMVKVPDAEKPVAEAEALDEA